MSSEIRLPTDVARCDGHLRVLGEINNCTARYICQRFMSLPPKRDADRCVWLNPNSDTVHGCPDLMLINAEEKERGDRESGE
jgi:hypothetical protein